MPSMPAMRRNLANLIIDSLKASGTSNAGEEASAASANGGPATELNLFGDREFLTAESATDALAPLLAAGSAIEKVCATMSARSLNIDACMQGPHAVLKFALLIIKRARNTECHYWTLTLPRRPAQIKLSTKSFGRDAAEVAAAAIANVASSLAHADLSDVIAGRPEAEALDALRIMCGALAGVRLRWAGSMHLTAHQILQHALVLATHACVHARLIRQRLVVNTLAPTHTSEGACVSILL